VPSASAPPSSGNSGLWRRTSSTGAVDAQGLGLIHPMTWIDERLFGWTRSSKRGTSAWSGIEDPSRANTPDESDEEDAGDYDDVVGLIPPNDDQDTRSRQNSYANLQRLRMNSASATHPLKSDYKSSNALNMNRQLDEPEESSRLLHRRRSTLSDDVPVESIAAIDPTMTFSDATESLNEAMAQAKYKGS
jgi:glycerol-3-phosphate O-acyltransferase/dihydroxyacetone phosphate acyltransferase